jgi:putative oxidoreductase
VASVELVCGVLLVVGLATRFAAVPLAITMIVAILTALRDQISGVGDLLGLLEFAYIAILFWIAIAGPGIVSLDALLLRFIGASDPAKSSPLVDVRSRARSSSRDG